MTSIFRMTLVLLAMTLLAGCTTRREVFAGHQADQVWTALVAAAQTPDYSSGQYTGRWTVRENNVWVNQEEHRIEIERQLERELHQPGAQPLHEKRQWKFQVTLEPGDPPAAAFISRELGVPAHVWDEAERYFADVWALLSKPQTDEIKSPAEANEQTFGASFDVQLPF